MHPSAYFRFLHHHVIQKHNRKARRTFLFDRYVGYRLRHFLQNQTCLYGINTLDTLLGETDSLRHMIASHFTLTVEADSYKATNAIATPLSFTFRQDRICIKWCYRLRKVGGAGKFIRFTSPGTSSSSPMYKEIILATCGSVFRLKQRLPRFNQCSQNLMKRCISLYLLYSVGNRLSLPLHAIAS